jgi:hypothetical protein
MGGWKEGLVGQQSYLCELLHMISPFSYSPSILMVNNVKVYWNTIHITI